MSECVHFTAGAAELGEHHGGIFLGCGERLPPEDVAVVTRFMLRHHMAFDLGPVGVEIRALTAAPRIFLCRAAVLQQVLLQTERAVESGIAHKATMHQLVVVHLMNGRTLYRVENNFARLANEIVDGRLA